MNRVIQVEALGVLLKKTQGLAVGVLNLVDDMVWLCEIDLVVVPDDLPLALGLQAHFDNIS